MLYAITVTSPGYADVKIIEVETDQLDRAQAGLSPWVKLQTHLTAMVRDRHTKMSPAWVVSSLYGAKTEQTPTILITVRTGYLVVRRGWQEVVIRVNNRPMPNQIKDYRTKPAPFLRDGSCRG